MVQDATSIAGCVRVFGQWRFGRPLRPRSCGEARLRRFMKARTRLSSSAGGAAGLHPSPVGPTRGDDAPNSSSVMARRAALQLSHHGMQ